MRRPRRGRLVLMVTLMLSLLAAPLATETQPAGKVPRIAFLWAGCPASKLSPWGWHEGRALSGG